MQTVISYRIILCTSRLGRIVVWFTITYALSAYHHTNCDFEFFSWPSGLDKTLCDKVCQCLATGRWFPPPIKLTATI